MKNYTLLTFNEIESTSNLLKEHYSSLPHFTFVKTNYQLKGRGQYERTWISNRDENVLFSILLKDLKIGSITYLKKWIIEGLSTLLHIYGVASEFREPNDIFVNDLKISGILFETRSFEDNLDYVVIGIGLNVNQVKFPNVLATSMKLTLKETLNVEKVFNQLIDVLINSYQL